MTHSGFNALKCFK